MHAMVRKLLLLVALLTASVASLVGPGPSPTGAQAGQAPPATTSPVTTGPVTNAPVTTPPVTTPPVTTLPVTTLPVTTLPVTTLPVTTLPVTTLPVTTLPVTTAPGVDQGCDELIHDPEQRLNGGPELVAALGRLLDQGVQIRVRVQAELPDVGAVADLERTCGWLADGRRSDEAMLLVVVPGTDKAGLWYGDGLRARIGARFAQLRSDLSPEELATGPGVTVLLDGLAVLIATEEPADHLGCDQLVWDPDGVLAGELEVADAAMALQAEGNDIRVRVEPPTDGDLDARLAQLEESCPGWQQDGDRPADRLIVMVQPGSRSSGLWYGVDFSDSLSSRWEDIQTETMNPRFRSGDFGEGLAAGLAQLSSTGRSPSRFDYRDYLDQPTDAGKYSSDRSDSGTNTGGAVGLMVLFALLAGGAWVLSYLNWKSKVASGETTESFGSYSSRRSGGSRHRSFGGFGGRSFGGRSSGGRSSGGGHRSSGGGGRRSGGGSTRW